MHIITYADINLLLSIVLQTSHTNFSERKMKKNKRAK